MRIQIRIPLTILALILLGVPGACWAASIGGSFIGRGAAANLAPSESAGVFPQANWNNIDSGDPVVDGTSLSQLNNAGDFTAVKIIYDASDSWNSDGGTATPDEKLMKGIIKANPDPDTAPANNSDRMVFVITNLSPAGTYTIIVYATANGVGAQMDLTLGATTYYIEEQNNFTASGATFVPATSTTVGSYELGPNYAGFTNVAPAPNGTITITAKKFIMDPQINDGIGVAGIQIVQVSGPAFPPNTDTCSITANPQDAATMVGGTVAFTVGAQGPRKIQWTKGNVPIPGATDATYSYTPVLADNGALIRAIVYNNVNTNTSAAATLFVGTPTLTQGFLTAARWTGMGGTAVQAIKDAIANSTAPNSTFYVSGPNIPQTAPGINDFGVRVSGWLKPDVTGWYDFFTRSDDASAVFINAVNPGTGTNTLPDVNVDLPIAEEIGCCEGFKEPVRTDAGGFQPYETTTEPIHLEAGKLYGFVALYKEGGGGDFLQVAWRLTNSTTAAGALTPISLANCYTLASGAGQQASISSQPASTQVVEGRTAIFNAAITTLPAAGLFGVQWLKNGTPIPGATTLQYTTPLTALADNNAQFQVIAYTLLGILTSSPPAVLTVIPDTFPPIPAAGAIATVGGAIQVGVGFDEAVNQADLVPGNFSVIGATTATARVATNGYGDYSAVIIDTTGLVPGNTYTARVSNVRDLKGNAISAAGVNATFTVPANRSWAESGVPKIAGQVIPVGADGFDILNGGRKEWEAYDEVTMAYARKTNDFDVKVQVVYAEPGSQWTRVGLMARNQLDVGEGDGTGGVNPDASAYAQTHVNPSQTVWSANRGPAGATSANPTPNNGHEQNQRLALGGATSGWGSAGTAPNYPNEWLRLQRTGASLQGFRSTDGVNWTAQGSTTLTDQQAEMFVGPFVAVETGNIWNGVDHNVFTSPFNPVFDRLFVAQFRNFADIVAALPPPLLSGSRSGGNIVITYTGVLQSSTTVTGTYTDVIGATSPYTTPTTGPERYYRARN